MSMFNLPDSDDEQFMPQTGWVMSWRACALFRIVYLWVLNQALILFKCYTMSFLLSLSIVGVCLLRLNRLSIQIGYTCIWEVFHFPYSGSGLASIFGTSKSMDSGDSSFTYTAPKQPKKQTKGKPHCGYSLASFPSLNSSPSSSPNSSLTPREFLASLSNLLSLLSTTEHRENMARCMIYSLNSNLTYSSGFSLCRLLL